MIYGIESGFPDIFDHVDTSDGVGGRMLYQLPTSFMKIDDGEYKCSIVDVETTGLEDDAEVIAFHYLTVTFSDDMEIFSVIDHPTMYRQPSKPISEEITRITGITNEMVEGKSISEEDINAIFEDVEFVIAHHSKFDYGKIHKTFPFIRNDITWGCTVNDIDWNSKGAVTASLASLTAQFTKCYMNHHDPKDDCWAAFWLMHQNFDELTKNMFKEEYLVSAWKSPFSEKDKLKAAGFYWNAVGRVWEKVVDAEGLDDAESVVIECGGEPESSYVDATKRFKS